MAAQDQSKEQALEAIRSLARPFPAGFKFDRREANERESVPRAEESSESDREDLGLWP
jgi:hypothetical protein